MFCSTASVITVLPLTASCASAEQVSPHANLPAAHPELSDDEAVAVALSVYQQRGYLMDTTTVKDSRQFRKITSVTTDEYFSLLSSDGSFADREYYWLGHGEVRIEELVDVDSDDDGADISENVQKSEVVPSRRSLSGTTTRFAVSKMNRCAIGASCARMCTA